MVKKLHIKGDFSAIFERFFDDFIAKALKSCYI
jgi:hypothetical protein